MKKIFLLSLILVSFSITKAQQLPNSGFESWTDSVHATDWSTSFNFVGTEVPVAFRSDIARSGNHSIGLATVNIQYITVPIPGIATLGLIDANVTTSNIDITGSIPFTGKPTKINGYFLYNPMANDYSRISAYVYNNNDTIAKGKLIIDTTVIINWTAFELILYYTDTNLSADAINIILESSVYDANNTPVEGSVLLVDDLVVSYDALAINKYSVLEGISLYPNPSSDFINVTNQENKDFDITIYNANAQVMYHNSSKSHYNIDISKYPNATYFVKCNIGNKVFTSKIVK